MRSALNINITIHYNQDMFPPNTVDAGYLMHNTDLFTGILFQWHHIYIKYTFLLHLAVHIKKYPCSY